MLFPGERARIRFTVQNKRMKNSTLDPLLGKCALPLSYPQDRGNLPMSVSCHTGWPEVKGGTRSQQKGRKSEEVYLGKSWLKNRCGN